MKFHFELKQAEKNILRLKQTEKRYLIIENSFSLHPQPWSICFQGKMQEPNNLGNFNNTFFQCQLYYLVSNLTELLISIFITENLTLAYGFPAG